MMMSSSPVSQRGTGSRGLAFRASPTSFSNAANWRSTCCESRSHSASADLSFCFVGEGAGHHATFFQAQEPIVEFHQRVETIFQFLVGERPALLFAGLGIFPAELPQKIIGFAFRRRLGSGFLAVKLARIGVRRISPIVLLGNRGRVIVPGGREKELIGDEQRHTDGGGRHDPNPPIAIPNHRARFGSAACRCRLAGGGSRPFFAFASFAPCSCENPGWIKSVEVNDVRYDRRHIARPRSRGRAGPPGSRVGRRRSRSLRRRR